MKRYLLPVLIMCCVCAGSVYAQKLKPYESQITYQKGVQPATLIDLPYPEDVVESSIKDYMARQGWKGVSSRGYKVYKNIRLDQSDTALSDLHIKVDPKSSRDKSQSIVTLLSTRAGVIGSPSVPSRTEKMAIASRKLATGPAATMIARCHSGLKWK